MIADDLLVFGEGDDIESATKDHDEKLKKRFTKSSGKNVKLNKAKQRESQIEDD